MTKVPDIETQYDKIGNVYNTEKESFYKTAPNPGTDFILRHLIDVAGKELVDVGCGGGEGLATYSKLGFKSVIGVDPSLTMVKAAREKLGQANVQHGSWTGLPFSNSSKDYLVGRFSFHYVEDIESAYEEAYRVLKPQGLLLLILPHPDIYVGEEILTKKGKEYVRVPLFNGKVYVVYPQHTLEEFNSKVFQKLFEVIDREDIKDSAVKTDTNTSFGIAACKR